MIRSKSQNIQDKKKDVVQNTSKAYIKIQTK